MFIIPILEKFGNKLKHIFFAVTKIKQKCYNIHVNSKGENMKKYKVSMINDRLNFRMFVTVLGYSCSDAGDAARKMLGPEGYDRIESIRCIGYCA